MSLVTYVYPVAGTVPPTAAQMMNAGMIIAKVNLADTDTTVPITTNFGAAGTGATTDLANLFPLISAYDFNRGTAPGGLTYAHTDSNTITVNKVSAAGSGGTTLVQLLLPNTLIR